jgi:DNA-binding response OmpR family regulator
LPAVHVLLIAQESDTASRLLEALNEREITVARSAKAGEGEHMAAGGYTAVVFDPSLVDRDFVSRVRRRAPGLPLVALVHAPSSERVAAELDAGVDEALHTGMSTRELGARVATAVRRTSADSSAVIGVGPLQIDLVEGEATWEGRDLGLTRREREVLHVLAESLGRVVRRENLYRRVWGYAMARGDRSVDVNIRRLRAKLAAAGADALAIKTQAGYGYRLELAEVVTEL